MATNKKSFILYCDIITSIEQLTDEEAGILFKHIVNYVNDKNPVIENRIVNLAFEPIKQQLKRDLKEWETQRYQRSEAGKKGMQNRYNKPNTVITEPNTVKSDITELTVNVNVNDTVNVTEEKRKLFCDSIFSYFEIPENLQPLNIQKLHLFYSTLFKENKIDLFNSQFEKYKKYRIDTKNKFRFSLDNFIKDAWFANSWETKVNLKYDKEPEIKTERQELYKLP